MDQFNDVEKKTKQIELILEENLKLKGELIKKDDEIKNLKYAQSENIEDKIYQMGDDENISLYKISFFCIGKKKKDKNFNYDF